MAAMLAARRTTEHYVNEEDRILYDDTMDGVRSRGGELPSMEPGGPRSKIFFDPSKTRVAIVTCGGLCPGLNDVIAGLVRTLTYHYQVRRIIGHPQRLPGLRGRLRARRGRPDPGVGT